MVSASPLPLPSSHPHGECPHAAKATPCSPVPCCTDQLLPGRMLHGSRNCTAFSKSLFLTTSALWNGDSCERSKQIHELPTGQYHPWEQSTTCSSRGLDQLVVHSVRNLVVPFQLLGRRVAVHLVHDQANNHP